MSDTANAFRAGLVIVIGTVIAVAFWIASNKTLNDSNSMQLHAYLTDSSGLTPKSAITVAGLQVGRITGMDLVDVTFGELMPDLDERVHMALGMRPQGAAPLEVNEDFDAVIQGLIAQHKLPTRDDVATKKATSDDVAARIVAIAKDRVTVAKVEFRVGEKGMPLPKDTWMKKDSAGLLGAKVLYLEKGPSAEMLKSGDRLVNVRSMTGTDALLAKAEGIIGDVQNITHKLDRDIGGITGDIKGITGELNRFVNGDGETMPLDQLYKLVMNDLRKLSGTVEQTVRSANSLIKDNNEEFSKLVKNVQHISADIADLTAKGEPGKVDGGPANEGDIRATMSSVRKVADDLSVVTAQLKDLLGENNGDAKDEVKSLKTTITELNRTLSSLSEVAGRVERGEGTVGRLLTDEKIADKVESAVSGAADYVSSLTSMEAHIDIGTAYNFNRGGTTTTLGLQLQPKPDKFYLIEIVDDGGHLERFTETDQNGNFLRESIRQENNQMRITAMFAKQFFDFLVLRVGLLETTGGVGMNIYFLDKRVELRSDLFDFRGPRDTLREDNLPSFYLPRWRTQIKAQPIQYIYFSAGVDDVLNSYTASGFHPYTSPLKGGDGYGFDYFVGIGLTFKDDDLRNILPFIPGG